MEASLARSSTAQIRTTVSCRLTHRLFDLTVRWPEDHHLIMKLGL